MSREKSGARFRKRCRKMNFQYSFLLLSMSIIFFSVPVIAQDYLALQGSATGSGGGTGNIIVEIWSAATSGSLLYNSSNDFNGVISSSRYDILLGNGTNPLSLNFSGTYYMEMYINGRDIDFNSSERQVFQSPVGNITVDDPMKTTSSSTYAFNVNDRFNVSGGTGDTTISGIVNISGTTTLSGVTTVANFFNVTPATSQIRTNGTVTILNTDDDDGLNVTGGLFVGQGNNGAQIAIGPTIITDTGIITTQSSIGANGNVLINSLAAQALSINAGFNVSGPTNALTTNGTVTIQSRASPALSIQGFNVSGSNADVRTNGTVMILSADIDDALNVTGAIFSDEQFKTDGAYVSIAPATALGLDVGGFMTIANFFNVTPATSVVRTNGTITVTSADVDDAVNISSGGAFVGGNVVFNRFFNVTTTASAVRTNGTVMILSADIDDALNVTGAIFSDEQFKTDGGYVSTAPATALGLDVSGFMTIANFFNVTPATSVVRTNGTITVTSADVDDAVNISSGGAFVGGNVVFNRFFNVTTTASAVRTNGTVTILSADQDGALNISGGGLRAGDDIDFMMFSLNPSDSLFTFKNIINISAAGDLRIGAGADGRITIVSTSLDALNVSGSALIHKGNLTIGQNITTDNQHYLKIAGVIGNATGTNKCSYIQMQDENGGSHFMWFDSGGNLRTGNATPSTCDSESLIVGQQ